jgi:hypothetical protein
MRTGNLLPWSSTIGPILPLLLLPLRDERDERDETGQYAEDNSLQWEKELEIT